MLCHWQQLPHLIQDGLSYVQSQLFPFRIAYRPQALSNTNKMGLIASIEMVSSICTSLPLPVLMTLASSNKLLRRAVNDKLHVRVSRIVSLYLDQKVDEFIELIHLLGGVYTGLAFIDFVNGNNMNLQRQRPDADDTEQMQCLDVMVATRSMATIIDFFRGFGDDMIKVCTKTTIGMFLHAGAACDTVVTIQHTNVGLQQQKTLLLTTFSTKSRTLPSRYMARTILLSSPLS